MEISSWRVKQSPSTANVRCSLRPSYDDVQAVGRCQAENLGRWQIRLSIIVALRHLLSGTAVYHDPRQGSSPNEVTIYRQLLLSMVLASGLPW
ncbi:hypothetical protein J6590_048646 [Homalodisca vitripennis]|nr:hypothetical protein J6590_048646 [Homalodisca vitripennis]